jgi:hypothetical protein
MYTVSGVSVENIAKYYQDSLTAQGWDIEGTANLGMQSVVGAKKDTRTFGASIADSGNGVITVTAGLEL